MNVWVCKRKREGRLIRISATTMIEIVDCFMFLFWCVRELFTMVRETPKLSGECTRASQWSSKRNYGSRADAFVSALGACVRTLNWGFASFEKFLLAAAPFCSPTIYSVYFAQLKLFCLSLSLYLFGALSHKEWVAFIVRSTRPGTWTVVLFTWSLH